MYESERLDKLQRKAGLLYTGVFRITSNEKSIKIIRVVKVGKQEYISQACFIL